MGKLDGHMSALGAALAAEGFLVAAALIKVTAGTRTVGAENAGTNPTEASYAAQGYVARRKATKIAGTLVEQADRVVVLLGRTIEGAKVPTSKDKVTIDGETLRVIAVDSDLAKFQYRCLCRK